MRSQGGNIGDSYEDGGSGAPTEVDDGGADGGSATGGGTGADADAPDPDGAVPPPDAGAGESADAAPPGAGGSADAALPEPDAAPLEPACVDPGQQGECTLADHPDRPYTAWIPEHDGRTPMPVVIAFHGGGGNARAGALSTCPDGDLADAECLHAVGLRTGFATVYPNGTVGPRGGNSRIWNGGGGGEGWACVGFCRADIDEAGYVRAVLDDLSSWLPVDADRVYAVGLSNGGVMTHRMGCELPERLAAIATIGAGNQYATSAPCEPGRPIPILHIHGTEDGCWPYDGGPIVCQNPNNTVPVIGVADSMAGWAERNGCSGDPETTDGPERVDDDISVEVDTWGGCGAPTVHYRVIGGGHTWLGGRQFLPAEVIGPAYPDVSNEDIWAFFEPLRR